MKEMINLEEANQILGEKSNYLEQEYVNLKDAHKRILSKDIISTINQPPFDRSPLDGYALKSEDTKCASKENGIALEIIEEVCAGSYPTKDLKNNTATRIMTGAPIPKGADCVIRQEDTYEKDGKVYIHKELNKFQNYCFEGEDLKKGEVVIKKNTEINFGEVGVIASLGIKEVPVYKKPKIAILSTGDELLHIGEKLTPGKIYNSNIYTISARLKELNTEPVILGISGDDIEKTAKNILDTIDEVDLIITTGGVSVGKKDIIKDVMKKINADILFWKVDLKPGTPVLCSCLKDKLIISLSGNPAAATITFELLVRPLLNKMVNKKDSKLKRVIAVFDDTYLKKSNRRRFLRGELKYSQNGPIVKLTSSKQSSGVLSSIIKCNCLIEVAEGSDGIKKGDKVEIIPLKMEG
ncbi:MAG: molybdopterin molybdotransferase MoeA [Tepidibacter sp.]|uniref:molybdopterin molybdotransferase MoeA n=1 Tax=Tepidibacter sp. TaxID=2529387 RepID=UPI0025D71729|nr:gephyrin-like molybdotransferase Glp [Tepidibacter sp.]MCT4507618.1 molybdopterin molybdotransferase MoeA [Tepidibacter sp.]